MIPDIDPVQLAQQAIQALQAHWGVVGAALADGALKEAGKSVFVWLKERFTSKAAAGALEEAEADPENTRKSKALALQIEDAIETDPEFRERLVALLPTTQSATVTGNDNVTVQNTGSGNQFSIRGRGSSD